MTRLHILILGGTSEASSLARAIAEDTRMAPVLSLAGRTATPALPPIPCRLGGFGGIQGLVDYLRAQGIEALIDATHPFASQMTAHARAAAAICGIPVLRIDRPPWMPELGDDWTMVPDIAAAARALGATPRRVFLTIGQKELAPFRAAPWHHYTIRSVDPPAPSLLPPRAAVITARGPFAEAEEHTLLLERRIDVLVTKNSGGAATEQKLAAARRLGLPVVMVTRPATPPMPKVADADAALGWIEVRIHEAAPRRV
ncbi:MAG TPA: cobalt-precorrin-6A reductase [Acetobacteraceae bacterium]|nr:cobalt-precorrin-6A reductase [Acetobacteraceae bacterium]